MKTKLLVLFHLALALHVQAGSAVWSQSPVSADWYDPANWMPQTVPNGPDDTATFGHSTQYSVSLPTFSSTVLNTILFRLDAQTYTITVPAGSDLTVEGHGIIYDFLPDGHYIVTDPGGIVILKRAG